MVKQDRARRTHALVLDAAAAEFSALGFASTNLQVVAARTGLTKGALYGHFPSKSALAVEITRQFEESWRELLRCVDKETVLPLTALHALLLGLAQKIQTDVRFTAGLRLVSEEARAKGEVPEVLTELRGAMLHLAQQAQKDGDIDAGIGAEPLSHLLLSLVLGIHHTTSAGDSDSVYQRVVSAWELLLPLMRRPVR
ncbi:TetR family transcriptional regulator [Streptomyces sclerotialus]|uniref:TetR family transcriptional regulator n=1 Tax=Streptomyces sclerotialus TaxID=1957 RepID=UPI0006924493